MPFILKTARIPFLPILPFSSILSDEVIANQGRIKFYNYISPSIYL